MTDAERHARASTLFLDALEQPADARWSWLEQACDDPDVRAAAYALLEAHTEEPAFLDTPLLPRLQGRKETAVPSAQGRRIGPWRIEDRLGEGGMGVVYRAARADGLYERTVALKLLPTSFLTASEYLVRRLEAERQILARLEHEGIARLYDGGVTEEGLPYLALELVDGEPITTYCDRRGLGAAARVALFARACDAVAYAHRSLVVHRDIKPAHILVVEDEAGGEPAVKLLDFGVSALVDDAAGEGLTLPTVPRALTPAYAAPEQVRGEPVTTAADVYALGVVLYELLAGRRPYELSGKTAAEIERLVAEIEPPPPSAVAPPERARILRGDLDTIVMKALAKEPARRYASAADLAADLRRYGRGLPVEARPATMRYRAGRFVRRHRAGVIIASAAVVLVVGFVGLHTARLAAERDRTAAALVQAEGTLAFLERTILMGDPQRGDFDAPLSTVLDSAAARVDEVADPAVAASIHYALANVYIGRGLTEQAEYHAHRALEHYGADDRNPRKALLLNLVAQARSDRGNPQEGLPYHEEAIARLRLLEDAHYELAVVLNTYGVTLYALDRAEDAVAALRESVDHYRGVEDPVRAGEIANPLNNLIVLMLQRSENEEALRLSEQLVAELRRRKDPQAAYILMFALYNWATALSHVGRTDSSLLLTRESIALREAWLGADHPETIGARVGLAYDLHRVGRLAEARQEAEAVLQTALATLEPGHPNRSYAQNIAGMVLCDAGDPERGAALLQASRQARRETLPADHWLLAAGESLLGACLARLGRIDEAGSMLAKSYAMLRTTLGDADNRTRTAYQRLQAFEASTGRQVPVTTAAGK